MSLYLEFWIGFSKRPFPVLGDTVIEFLERLKNIVRTSEGTNLLN